MAKLGSIQKTLRIKRCVAKYAGKRAELKKIAMNRLLDYETRDQARRALYQLPRDSSPTRVRNRCQFTGRSRGFLWVGMSRIAFDQLASSGLLNGFTKASW